MDIIPVIDVRHGQAVRAVAGERNSYRPLSTILAEGCDPLEVARGYGALYPFKTLYVADLDGIERGAANTDLLAGLAKVWPGERLLVDDGGLGGPSADHRIVPVLGSETLLAAGVCQVVGDGAPLGVARCLSLDFRGDQFIGPQEVLASPALWPHEVIVMTLGAVGKGEGPELARVVQIVECAGADRKVYAAGGVRNRDDLRALKAIGVAGVLVASALHDGKLKAGDLEEIAGF